MGNLGMPEILMILVIALIIFGPRKLPELGKSLGHGLAQFRKASDDFKRQWEEEVEIEKRRLDTAPIESASPSESAAETSAAAASEYATSDHTIHAPVPTVETASVPRSESTVKETKRDWM
ncbi:MAG TPA: twin-arginine translocase TatA/TatE family subunit [Blastocatellia bacterium]|nr:twin-arginine translocase TatA/TatE family subunit [Blastocatellia bacterium]